LAGLPARLRKVERIGGEILSARVVATAFSWYGIALVYGASGSTNLMQIASADSGSNLLRLGLTLILVGLAQGGSRSFSGMDADVYEGAPTR